MAIYHAVRYHQSQNEKDKEHILEEMKMEGLSFGKRKGKVSEKIKPEPEKELDEELGFRLAKDDAEISRINKKMIDLSLHDSEERTGIKQEYKFKLP